MKYISILGIGRGVGTTHLAIMAANYLANGLGKKVAVVEMNEHTDFLWIKRQSKTNSKKINMFSYCGIDFYQSVQSEHLINTEQDGYEYIIKDINTESLKYETEYESSNLRIMVASMELWDIRKIWSYLKSNKKYQHSLNCLVSVTWQKQLAEELEQEFKINIKPIPLERNPFAIHGESLLWFEKLFADVL